MTPNASRIVEAILTVVAEAERRETIVSQYDVVKALFLADRAHLNRYGRPITYDNYIAMQHGPVPGLAYDFLRERRQSMHAHAVSAFPWHRRAAPELGSKCFAYEKPARAINVDVLSPSDIDGLQSALTVVSSLTFSQIRRLTHDDVAYVDAWEDSGTVSSFPMSYSLLFDNPNAELARELSFMSSHIG